ncbi:MAG: glycine--tRNA ligase subunit beta [Psychrilyobacter sp.]|uniref:glycine--tRNA ligase subunit beta n=1 Tax=Psychrilyobacter sp. TaxID=2586924 RepID=UPI003C78FFF8
MNILLEIGMEEIPARFLKPALNDLEKNMKIYLKENRIVFEDMKTYGTPRRLILSISNLAEKQEDLNILNQGPAKHIAFGSNGDLTKAGMGFAKSQGIEATDLEIIETSKGEYIAAKKFVVGQETKALLPEALKGLLEGLTFPKSMKWADKKMKFARPIQWLLALEDNNLIEFEVAGYKSGTVSKGHRFFGEKEFNVTDIDDYFKKIRANNVIIDIEERKNMIVEMINKNCSSAGEKVVIEKELLEEVTNLVEYPYPIVGTFNSEFLEVPQEVLIISMQVHQRYFPILDSDGHLLPKFVVVRNGIDGSENVRIGNEKVLSARLSDARFFYQEDLKKPLSENVEKLKNVVFQKDLGTIYKKLERSKRIAEKLVDILGFDGNKTDILRTIELSKADLVSNMIGEKEFTKLQGFIGAEYALRSGENEKVAKGIEEHYYPRYQGDKLPQNIEGVITGICDRIDTLVGCFGIGLIPSGSKDPFALRRAALGIVNIIFNSKLDLSIDELINISLDTLELDGVLKKDKNKVKSEVMEFMNQRIINVFLDKGYRKDFIMSVLNVKNENLLEVEKKLLTLNKVSSNENFNELVSLLKRVGNISKDYKGVVNVSEGLLKEDAEKSLYSFYMEFMSVSEEILGKNDYLTYLKTILSGKEIIDGFFDTVMVMDKDEKIKNNRLSLLTSLNIIFNRVANLNLIDIK